MQRMLEAVNCASWELTSRQAKFILAHSMLFPVIFDCIRIDNMQNMYILYMKDVQKQASILASINDVKFARKKY